MVGGQDSLVDLPFSAAVDAKAAQRECSLLDGEDDA